MKAMTKAQLELNRGPKGGEARERLNGIVARNRRVKTVSKSMT
jgi:hypothetical protein